MEDAFCSALTRAQAAGEVNPKADPRDLARLLLCTTQGIALLGRVMENDSTLAGTVRATLALLESG